MHISPTELLLAKEAAEDQLPIPRDTLLIEGNRGPALSLALRLRGKLVDATGKIILNNDNKEIIVSIRITLLGIVDKILTK
jgi:hypothetical protein